MFQLKPKSLNDEERIERLKIIFEQCDVEDYSTKKLKGLLFDAIPNDNGLKTRVELMGQSGYLEKLKRSSAKEMRFDGKVEKWATAFADAYGFTKESSLGTFYLCAKALSIPIEPLRVVPTEIKKSVQGNFSKKHIQVEASVSESSQQPIIKSTSKPPSKRKNNLHTLAYVFYLIVVPLGLLELFSTFGAWENIKTIATYVLGGVFYEDAWVLGISASVVLASVVPWAVYKRKNINLTVLYPFVTALIQLVSMALYEPLPILYEKIQLAQIAILYFSFLFMMSRGTKHSSRSIASKALFPYYFTTALFFGIQYLVRMYL